MDDLSFLQSAHSGTAALTIFFSGGNSQTIHGLDLDTVAAACPLLALCFEEGHRGPHHSIEATSASLIISFLRYLYTGDYVITNQDGEAEPCSLLTHAELCHLGNLFDAPALIVQAHCNIIRDTELACSKPDPPQALCEAIRFIYENLADQRELIDTILNYCVSCFLYHGLSKSDDFRKIAYEVRRFHNDLCRTNFARGFVDDGAIDIIRLPVNDLPDPKSFAEEKAALGDFLYELWGDAATPFTTPYLEPTFAVVRRPRTPAEKATIEEIDGSTSDDSLSDAEGFSLVHRPKAKSMEHPDVFEDTEAGWLGIGESLDKNAGLYLHPGLSGSNVTIKPILRDLAMDPLESLVISTPPIPIPIGLSLTSQRN